jgi:predicted RNase H-like nuclease (RuvC/YqgF family)
MTDIVERLKACLRFDTPSETESELEQCAREAADEIGRLRAELEAANVRIEQWEQKATTWLASPEAAQRLDGYRDLAQRLNTTEKQRDELLEDLQIIASVAHCGGLGELNVDDVVMAIRHWTTPYFRKDASEGQHRAAIATVKGETS